MKLNCKNFQFKYIFSQWLFSDYVTDKISRPQSNFYQEKVSSLPQEKTMALKMHLKSSIHSPVTTLLCLLLFVAHVSCQAHYRVTLYTREEIQGRYITMEGTHVKTCQTYDIVFLQCTPTVLVWSSTIRTIARVNQYRWTPQNSIKTWVNTNSGMPRPPWAHVGK